MEEVIVKTNGKSTSDELELGNKHGVIRNDNHKVFTTRMIELLHLNTFEIVVIVLFCIADFIPVMIGQDKIESPDDLTITMDLANTLYHSNTYKISLLVSIVCSSLLLLLRQFDVSESVNSVNAESVHGKDGYQSDNSKDGVDDNVSVRDGSETIRVVYRGIVVIGFLLLLPSAYILFICIPLRQHIIVIRSINAACDTAYVYFFVKQLRILDPAVWCRLQYTVVYTIAIANLLFSFASCAPTTYAYEIILVVGTVLVGIAMLDTFISISMFLYKMRVWEAASSSQYFTENDERKALRLMYMFVLAGYLLASWVYGLVYFANGPCEFSCWLGEGNITIYTYVVTFVSVTITMVSSYVDRRKQASAIVREKCAYESLLSQMLPPSKVGMYLKYGKIAPEEHHDTALFLSDIEGFTAIAARSEPYQVMEMLDKIYRIMDHVAKQSPRLYKLETIGDAYVITSGLFNCDHPEENAIAIANFALIVREAVALVVSPVDNTPIRIRIGINSGDVMSGVIGDLMPRWCLFGDTMNFTSRLESSCESGCIHMSIEITKYLKKSQLFEVKARGMVNMKGKGEVFTYNLVSATDDNPLANRRMIDQILEECRELIK